MDSSSLLFLIEKSVVFIIARFKIEVGLFARKLEFSHLPGM